MEKALWAYIRNFSGHVTNQRDGSNVTIFISSSGDESIPLKSQFPSFPFQLLFWWENREDLFPSLNVVGQGNRMISQRDQMNTKFCVFDLENRLDFKFPHWGGDINALNFRNIFKWHHGRDEQHSREKNSFTLRFQSGSIRNVIIGIREG